WRCSWTSTQRSGRLRAALAAAGGAVAPVFDAENLAEGVEGLWDDGVVGPLAALVTGEQAGLGEDLEVVRERGLGQVDGLGEVGHAGLGSLVGGDDGEQAQPGGVGQGLEHRRQVARLPVRERLADERGAARRLDLGSLRDHRHDTIIPHRLTSVDTIWHAVMVSSRTINGRVRVVPSGEGPAMSSTRTTSLPVIVIGA